MANEPLQLNLGSLRSAMSLTLHTHHASRIWHGRAPAEGRPGIIGLNGYISVMNKMKRGAEQDDPYSDWWMLRIEDKLTQTKASLHALREQVDQALADVPPALSLGENMNVQPVKLPLPAAPQRFLVGHPGKIRPPRALGVLTDARESRFRHDPAFLLLCDPDSRRGPFAFLHGCAHCHDELVEIAGRHALQCRMPPQHRARLQQCTVDLPRVSGSHAGQQQ